MSIGLFFICYRKRNQTREEDVEEADREWTQDKDSINNDSINKDW
jgi:hypothetical protein